MAHRNPGCSRGLNPPVSTLSTETFAPFDSADYLNTFQDVTAYLEAVLEDSYDDPKVIAAALGAIARSS